MAVIVNGSGSMTTLDLMADTAQVTKDKYPKE